MPRGGVASNLQSIFSTTRTGGSLMATLRPDRGRENNALETDRRNKKKMQLILKNYANYHRLGCDYINFYTLIKRNTSYLELEYVPGQMVPVF